MTIDNLSDLGGRVSVDIPAELHAQRTALGDGSLKPAHLAYIVVATGKIACVKMYAGDRFDGIVIKPYYGATDDAIPDGSGCQLIRPEQSRRYRLKCQENPGLSAKIGANVVWDWTQSGQVRVATGINTVNYPQTGNALTGMYQSVGRLAVDYTTGDKYLDMIWGA